MAAAAAPAAVWDLRATNHLVSRLPVLLERVVQQVMAFALGVCVGGN